MFHGPYVAHARGSKLSGLSLPAEQEKMSSAKTAAARPQQPEESVFDRIPHADISEFDRLAMRTVSGKSDEIRIHFYIDP
jgi:hypothetical protein